MGFHPKRDMRLEMAKDKIRGLHQEAEAWRLAKEARRGQPGRIRVTVNLIVGLFRLSVLKMKSRFAPGRIVREKAVRTRKRSV